MSGCEQSEVVIRARTFLNRLAEGARVQRLGVQKLDIESTYHYAKGFVQALEHFELCSPAEAEALSKQVGQWPAPLADDGKLWQQPWIEHGTKPLFVQTIHLSILDQKSPVQFDFDCEKCGNTGHFWVGPPWLEDGQTQAQGRCDICEDTVIAYSSQS